MINNPLSLVHGCVMVAMVDEDAQDGLWPCWQEHRLESSRSSGCCVHGSIGCVLKGNSAPVASTEAQRPPHSLVRKGSIHSFMIIKSPSLCSRPDEARRYHEPSLNIIQASQPRPFPEISEAEGGRYFPLENVI